MTDLEKFKALLDEVGQEYKYQTGKVVSTTYFRRASLYPPETMQALELLEGTGYSGFWAEFLFDANGKYITYAAWE